MDFPLKTPPGTDKKACMKKIKELGLDKINFERMHKLTKVSSKNPSPYGYPDEMVAMDKGKVFVVGNTDTDETLVWIALTAIRGDWFKTSPIVKPITKKNTKTFVIETKNSVYELERLGK